jgi:DNA-binding MarR family transcriptional regulator
MKQIVEAFGQRLSESGVTRIQWIALYYLGLYGEISQCELSNMMNVKDSSVGRLLDRMERDGLVERVRSQEDRRIVLVQLSEKGKAYREELIPLGVAFNNDLVEGISEKDLEVFENVLTKMVTNAQNIE